MSGKNNQVSAASFLCIFFLAICQVINGQHIRRSILLSDSVQETSGLIYLDGTLITHNDSGGDPKLYEIDPENGEFIADKEITNAINRDWEDLCEDQHYIYIADIGNNTGVRRDLTIYKLRKSDYFSNSGLPIKADSIRFAYHDQSTFDTMYLETKHDAETLISLEDKLYLFTKNWLNRKTYIYQVPKTPGNYQIQIMDSIEVPGVITGGCYNQESSSIVLTGYNEDSVFVTQITDFSQTNFSKGTVSHFVLNLPNAASHQIEGICVYDANNYYLTSEGNEQGKQMLYQVELGLAVNNRTPVRQNHINIDWATKQIVATNPNQNFVMSLYDNQGRLCKQSHTQKIDISEMNTGIYITILRNFTSNQLSSRKIVLIK